MAHPANATLIWDIAELLRGDYKQSEYGKVILPWTLLARLDAVLAPTKAAVMTAFDKHQDTPYLLDFVLPQASGLPFYNTSRFDLATLIGDAPGIKENLIAYVGYFSANVRDIFERYGFTDQLKRLEAAELLYLVAGKFAVLDLSEQAISNTGMGLMFEELIRHFSELSNETAGEHYTPREVIQLMVNLLFTPDDAGLQTAGIIRSIYDPAAGTGGMLTVAEEWIKGHNPGAKLSLFGQELNDESYAICKTELLIKGYDAQQIVRGNTFSGDGHAGKHFDYLLCNPPFGVEWKKVEKEVRAEHQKKGMDGRFGPGLPRISDGSLLFLLHLISKMRPAAEGGSRIAIVLNGSPLFTGGAGSGESDIRRWIIENDWLEAIVALPTDMFYNTGIATYIWLVSNRKSAEREGMIQLINASSMFQKMRKSLGSKRKKMSDDHIADVTRWYGAGEPTTTSKLFRNAEFGYHTITIERPLRDERGAIVRDAKRKPKPDPSLRDTENVPLDEDINAYFEREVLPHVPDAWIDHSKTKVGYEIPFTRHFYEYVPPRPLAAIDGELQQISREIQALLAAITAAGEASQ